MASDLDEDGSKPLIGKFLGLSIYNPRFSDVVASAVVVLVMVAVALYLTQDPAFSAALAMSIFANDFGFRYQDNGIAGVAGNFAILGAFFALFTFVGS